MNDVLGSRIKQDGVFQLGLGLAAKISSLFNFSPKLASWLGLRQKPLTLAPGSLAGESMANIIERNSSKFWKFRSQMVATLIISSFKSGSRRLLPDQPEPYNKTLSH